MDNLKAFTKINQFQMYCIKKKTIAFFFTSAVEFFQAFPSVFTAPL